MTEKKLSWGRRFSYNHALVLPSERQAVDLPKIAKSSDNGSILAYGLGRSYGDSNLNENGALIVTTRLNKFISADWHKGTVKVEAGVSLDEILQVSVPKGWFLPVTPGTKFVTVGGAVANDVHGKNHHNAGSFGNFVKSFALRRSDTGENPVICSPRKNKKLFRLTLGGLGLTGLIEWVEIQLKPVNSSFLYVENMPFNNFTEFLKISAGSADWEYSVAWVDCFAKGGNTGRGIFSRGRFVKDGALEVHKPEPRLKWPIVTPGFLLNKFSIKAFNFAYRKRPGARFKGYMHYDPFFFPLDRILNWNKIYGRKGFYQHQCLIGLDSAEEGIREILEEIERTGQGSFLAVLKVHGAKSSGGKLSFCHEGVSLALDFPNKGRSTLDLLARLDSIVVKHSGRLYPAKDGHMSGEVFQASFPNWKDLEKIRDPMFSSSFWRRVTSQEQGVI